MKGTALENRGKQRDIACGDEEGGSKQVEKTCYLGNCVNSGGRKETDWVGVGWGREEADRKTQGGSK